MKRVPWLASRDLLRELGAKIDIANDSVDFAPLELSGVKLRKSSGGHPAVDITQWPSRGYPSAGVHIEQFSTLALLLGCPFWFRHFKPLVSRLKLVITAIKVC